jgi:ABC 3 transport family
MFEYDFMQNAFAAAAIVAIVSGLVGYFVVLRGQTFAGHALAHVGFTGATGAVLIGVTPIWGLVMATVTAGVGMGAIGERLAGRDVAIGIVLALSLGLGLLFLHFFTAYATQATALLFGNVLAVDVGTVWMLLWLGVVSTGAFAVISRPLLFASLQPELAEAKGVSLPALFGVVPGYRGAGRRRVRADRRRAAGLCVDGRTRSGGPATDDRNRKWSPLIGWLGIAGSLDRHRARLLYRLADQLLDHRPERGNLPVDDIAGRRSSPIASLSVASLIVVL